MNTKILLKLGKHMATMHQLNLVPFQIDELRDVARLLKVYHGQPINIVCDSQFKAKAFEQFLREET